MGFLSSLLGLGADTAEMKKMIAEGALVIDVRTPTEFKMGHVGGAKNIPLDKIAKNATKLEKTGKTIILCCASGARSGRAAGILKGKGLENVHNGGGWNNLV